MSALACPVCGTEYESWSTKCLNCGVALVGVDEVDPRELPEADRVIYEVGTWPIDMQATAAEAMAESEIPHAWDGTDLVVHVQFEDVVDALLDAIEQEAGFEGEDGDGVDEEADDELDDDVLAYTLDEWRQDERDRLAELLRGAGVTHRWEDDVTLLVDEDDEATVESLLDQVEFPDALAAEGDLPDEGAQDADPSLLGALFLAADRLKGNPLDPSGLADLNGALEQTDPDVPPYGFDKELWRSAVERADEIADLIADEADRGDEVVAKASELRDLLRPYV
jgi:hypothetical protein